MLCSHLWSNPSGIRKGTRRSSTPTWFRRGWSSWRGTRRNRCFWMIRTILLSEILCRTDTRSASTDEHIQEWKKYVWQWFRKRTRVFFLEFFYYYHSYTTKIINGDKMGRCAGPRINHQAAGRSWKDEAPPKTSEGSTRGLRSS